MIEKKIQFFEEGDDVFYIKKKTKISIHAVDVDTECSALGYLEDEDIFAYEVWNSTVTKSEIQVGFDGAMHYSVMINGDDTTYNGFNEVFLHVEDAEEACKKMNEESKAKLKERNDDLNNIIDNMFTGSYKS